MQFVPPYVLYGALKAAEDVRIAVHAETYGALLTAIRDDTFDFDATLGMDVLTSDTLPLRIEA
jgi:glutathione-regulated potassium-efflux system ancillary protein KefG